jgi:2-desacetyl-2-hydroxyethyl bacteriochlorophyllide A dehydrogenase
MNAATMKALVYEGPRVMNMRETDVPVPGEDELLIRVEKVGICGSELGGYLGHNSLRKPPLIMGHEFAGVVESTGERVALFRPGDRVTANPLVSCGRCDACLSGSTQLCSNRSLIGAARPGAFAEYVVVPERNAHRLPDNVSFDDGAIVEPFACALHLCRLLRLSPLDRLLIVGAGPIGLFALIAAKQFGVREIVITDLNRGRLEIARQLGAEPVDASDAHATSRLGSFDAAIDAVGMTATRTQCVNSVRNGGRVIFSGLHEADSTLPINTAIRNEIEMRGAFAYTPLDFAAALDWIAAGQVDLSPWTVTEPLENGAACFEKLIGGPGQVAKILLSPGK